MDLGTACTVVVFVVGSSSVFVILGIFGMEGKRSTTTFGSEFKDTKSLERVLRKHPRWKKFKMQLTNGIDFYLEEMDDDLRRLDLHHAYERGNHKSDALKMSF